MLAWPAAATTAEEASALATQAPSLVLHKVSIILINACLVDAMVVQFAVCL